MSYSPKGERARNPSSPRSCRKFLAVRGPPSMNSPSEMPQSSGGSRRPRRYDKRDGFIREHPLDLGKIDPRGCPQSVLKLDLGSWPGSLEPGDCPVFLVQIFTTALGN